MENLIKELKDLDKKVDLFIRFDAPIPLENGKFFIEQDIKRIEKYTNNYEKNIELKFILNEKLKSEENKIDIYFWIIQNWGGIKNFKRNKKNEIRIEKFKKRTDKELFRSNFFFVKSSFF